MMEDAAMLIRTHQRHAPLLGRLELGVLELFWRLGSADAKGIQSNLDPRHRIALSTVQSTLERLFRKKLLTRSKVSHAYVYAPAVSRRTLISQMIRNVVSELADDDVALAMSGLIDLADPIDERTLERLERQIAERRKQVPADTSPRDSDV